MNIPLVEQDNVVNVYNKIAQDFSRTRYKVWPSIKLFVESFPCDTKFLEIGSGNGKNMLLRPNDFTGCDISEEFVKLCQNKGLNVIQADATDLPFDDDSFDATLLATSKSKLSAAKSSTTSDFP
jgi:SAM-dependent methyltransferase